MARIDHTACTHPRTPAGRRVCRANRPAASVVVTAPVVTPAPVVAAIVTRVLAPVAAPKARVRRPRVAAAGSTTCVQAALHTTGRCACGWAA